MRAGFSLLFFVSILFMAQVLPSLFSHRFYCPSAPSGVRGISQKLKHKKLNVKN